MKEIIWKKIIQFMMDNYAQEVKVDKNTTLAEVELNEEKFKILVKHLEVQFGVKLLESELQYCVDNIAKVTINDVVNIVYVKKCF